MKTKKHTMDNVLKLSKMNNLFRMRTVFAVIVIIVCSALCEELNTTESEIENSKIVNEEPVTENREIEDSSVIYISPVDDKIDSTVLENSSTQNVTSLRKRNKNKKKSAMRQAVQVAALSGLSAMIDLYERKEPEIYKKGED